MGSSATADTLVAVRPYRAADFDALYRLICSAGRVMTRAGLADHLDSPMLHAERDVLVVDAAAGHGLAGVRDVRVTGRGDEVSPLFESWGMVSPTAQPGTFEALLRAAVSRAGELVVERGATAGILQTRSKIEDAATHDLLEAGGLHSTRVLWTIVRPTLDGVEAPTLPPSIDLRPYRVGVDDVAWVEAFNDAFGSHWGGWMGMPLQVWTGYVRQPTFKPKISLVAWDGDRIAGFGHFRIDDELNALRGRRQGLMRYIGVRPAYRRLGLARALTRAGLLALRSAGMDSCASGVDGTNVTGAHQLYADEGFETVAREYLFRIDVPCLQD